jgi:aspartokinase-like uncharacterized kinase
MGLVVLKLGGSLLDRLDLQDRIRQLVLKRNGDRILMIVGGGSSADVVREWSQLYSLDDEQSHWIAIRSLAVTRSLVATLLPEFREVDSQEMASAAWRQAAGPLLLDVEAFLRRSEQLEQSILPHDWNVTSDSIAAWVAARWFADELILAKSVDLPRGASVEQVQRDGLVDVHFPAIAGEIRKISWCNLGRDPIQIDSAWRRSEFRDTRS